MSECNHRLPVVPGCPACYERSKEDEECVHGCRKPDDCLDCVSDSRTRLRGLHATYVSDSTRKIMKISTRFYGLKGTLKQIIARAERDDESTIQSLVACVDIAVNALNEVGGDEDNEDNRVVVPPFVSCAMCGKSDACEGEWTDGSEVRCLHCGKEATISSYDHESGYTHWVLHALYDEDEDE
jgi:hypothetical protein